MKDVNKNIENLFNFPFMESVDLDEVEQEYQKQLEDIRKAREERNRIKNIPYVQIPSPEICYIHTCNTPVKPIFTKSNGYGKVHVWVEDGIFNAGVELENRYVSTGDELVPKIVEYFEIPDWVVGDIVKGNYEKN